MKFLFFLKKRQRRITNRELKARIQSKQIINYNLTNIEIKVRIKDETKYEKI